MKEPSKVAVVSGAGGQDGQVLIKVLLRRGYRVVGLCSPDGPGLIQLDGESAIDIVRLDIRDRQGVGHLVQRERPDEFYNLAALSSAGGQWETAIETMEVNGLAVVGLLELLSEYSPGTRFCQASSCEMFGAASRTPQNECTPLEPDTPYAIAKAQAHEAVKAYRRHKGLFACSAVLFSHASEYRSDDFLIGKVTRGAAEVAAGIRDSLELYSLKARRDWGYAEDYMNAMHAMLQAESADDFVIASGESHSVEEVCDVAFAAVGLNHEVFVHTRHADEPGSGAAPYLGDTRHARDRLRWAPTVSFREMIERLTLFHRSQLSGSQK